MTTNTHGDATTGAGSDALEHAPVPRLTAALRRHLALHRAIGERAISLAHILRRPVRNCAGTRIGRVSDIVVRWDAATDHPPVTGIIVAVGRAVVRVAGQDVVLSQAEVRLRSGDSLLSWPVRRTDGVALARDVLDHQLVDTAGVQIVRAADVYLLDGPRGWELAGIDVGVRSFGRRILPWARSCPTPDRIIDWAELHAFVPRFTDTTTEWKSARTAAAGTTGSGLQLGRSAAQLKKLRAGDVASLLGGLGRPQQAELLTVTHPLSAAAALSQLGPDHRQALLAVLDPIERARLAALLDGGVR
jgi:hypothetical protein